MSELERLRATVDQLGSLAVIVAGLLEGLDGTMGKTADEVTADLRARAADGVPAYVNAESVADLIDAARAAGVPGWWST